jgi:hypothetical protein
MIGVELGHFDMTRQPVWMAWSMGRRSSSYQQNDQDDQEDGTESATDIWATKVETTTTEKEHQDDDQDYQVHVVRPSENASST